MQNVKFSLLVIKLKQYFPCMQIWLSLLKCRGLTGKCIKYTYNLCRRLWTMWKKYIQLCLISKLRDNGTNIVIIKTYSGYIIFLNWSDSRHGLTYCTVLTVPDKKIWWLVGGMIKKWPAESWPQLVFRTPISKS